MDRRKQGNFLLIVDVLVRFDLIWVWVVEGQESLDFVEILLMLDLIEFMHGVVLGKCRFGWILFGESVDYDSIPIKN